MVEDRRTHLRIILTVDARPGFCGAESIVLRIKSLELAVHENSIPISCSSCSARRLEEALSVRLRSLWPFALLSPFPLHHERDDFFAINCLLFLDPKKGKPHGMKLKRWRSRRLKWSISRNWGDVELFVDAMLLGFCFDN
jgi:hypothetical protein